MFTVHYNVDVLKGTNITNNLPQSNKQPLTQVTKQNNTTNCPANI